MPKYPTNQPTNQPTNYKLIAYIIIVYIYLNVCKQMTDVK